MTFDPVAAAMSAVTISNVQTDHAGLEILDRGECLRLLAGSWTGRIAISVRALPTILPVRYLLDGDELVLRTYIGSTLAAATKQTVVAFQVDGTEATTNLEWSVAATGVARHVTDAVERARFEEVDLPRWTSSTPDLLVSISTDHLAGRRFVGGGLPG